MPDDAAWLLALVRELGTCTDFETAATTLCTRLATHLGAARVVLGWRARGRAPCRAVALSGAGRPEWDGDTARRLAAAMDEAIDQARVLASPAARGSRAMVRAQDQARRAASARALMTVPLATAGVVCGALLLEFDRSPPPKPAERVLAAAAVALPWLRLLHAARPGPDGRLIGTLGPGRRFAAASRVRRWAIGVLALAAVAALALPIDLTVGAPARIEGEVQRTVAAPIRGYLKAVHVRPGDTVREGQVIAELGDRDLELERAKLKSELAQHEGGIAAAMAKGERGAMAVAQSKVDETRARLGLVDHQLEQIRLRAPIDGVVLQGDLWQQLGAPVDRGKSLFVVAPDRRHRVIVELDERDLRRIADGASGRLALSALPWDTMPVRIERIAPAAVAIDGRNVFELEARLVDGGDDALRAGQRGIVHIASGHGPLALDWARRAGDAFARAAWRWTP